MASRVVAVIVGLLLCASCASATDANDSSVAAIDSMQPTAAAVTADDVVEEPETAPAAEPAGPAGPADTDQPTVNDAFFSPLGEALGFDPDDRLAATNAYIRAAEELVRECMAAAGFDYIATDPGFAPSFERRLELEASLSDERFIEQYGYGIATLFELNFQGEGVMAFVEQLLGPPPTIERSGAEQQAYELALGGESIQGLTAEEAQEQTFNSGGFGSEDGSCRQIGYDAAENPQGEIFEGLQSLLGDELDAMGDRFEADSRVRDERRAWQRCMGEAGYAYEQTQDIRDELESKTDDIGSRFTSSPEALAIFAKAISANLAGMDGPARFDFLESLGALQGFSLVPALQEELDALIDVELAVSARSFACADRELLRQVQFEVEQDFVQAHADQLALIANGDQ